MRLRRGPVGQQAEGGDPDDGLELGAIYFGADRRKLAFVGARLHALKLDGDWVEEIRGTKAGLGYRKIPLGQTHEAHEITLPPSSRLYLTTDALIDQIGGARRDMFGKRRLKSLPEEIGVRMTLLPHPTTRAALSGQMKSLCDSI